MDMILGFLQHTPLWVYLLFLLLIWLGLQARRPRTLPLRRVFVTPAIFIVWGLVGLLQRAVGAPVVFVDWFALALCGGAVAAWTVRLGGLRANRVHGLVHLPGSVLPLVRNLVIFAAKYGLAAALALHQEWHELLAFCDVAVSGASAGYFLGWLGRFVVAYRLASESDLARVALAEMPGNLS